jgi:hypothetical protein
MLLGGDSSYSVISMWNNFVCTAVVLYLQIAGHSEEHHQRVKTASPISVVVAKA